MEKKRPHYDLVSIKATFSTIDGLRLTESSLVFASLDLGLSDAGIVDLIQTVQRSHFYKSMTSVRDHRIWQDVYHLPFEARLLYVKSQRTIPAICSSLSRTSRHEDQDPTVP